VLAHFSLLAVTLKHTISEPTDVSLLLFAAYHSTTMANTVGAPLLVFSKKGGMPALLSHYRPNKTVFAFTGEMLCHVLDDYAVYV
jgi:pyruvate kinase